MLQERWKFRRGSDPFSVCSFLVEVVFHLALGMLVCPLCVIFGEVFVQIFVHFFFLLFII